ncbi:STAS domain-containing protein [Actinomadura barringtoniae]|uniref:Anti-sigma factor antagonist n=1 Tax=Actinomadura barringtoniae TaxID=1427535 RepID=A0A939PQ30_9ACTN|nr:STAS domain-containing protein [Actinomadura barringtoniae]MBO2452626.1 STAS domain-containing protein [Actinomadura barringtoniae]
MTDDAIRHTRPDAPHWFAVRELDSPPGKVLYLSGELDLLYTPDLRVHIRAALDSDEVIRLVLDLSELEFIDSTGIGVLVWADREATERGRHLAVSGCGPRVRRVLNVYGVAGRLRLYESAEQALETT